MNRVKKKQSKPPLAIRLMALRYWLLERALILPALAVFRRANKRQERLQDELIKRGWEKLLCLPDWLVKARRKEEAR